MGTRNIPVQLEMEKRSPVKIMERTHEEATEALHACELPMSSAIRARRIRLGARVRAGLMLIVDLFVLGLSLWQVDLYLLEHFV